MKSHDFLKIRCWNTVVCLTGNALIVRIVFICNERIRIYCVRLLISSVLS